MVRQGSAKPRSPVRLRLSPPSPDVLSKNVVALGGVGPVAAEQLERLGIRTVGDLVRHYPYRYEDLRTPQTAAGLLADRSSGAPPLGEVNMLGVIRSVSHVRLRGRARAKTTAVIDDGTGTFTAIWFGRPYLGSQLKTGQRVFVRGRLDFTLAGPQVLVARHRVVPADEPYDGELVPVYPLTASLANFTMRRLVAKALRPALANGVSESLEILPAAIAKRRKFPTARWALRAIHQPRTPEEAGAARARLVFEEFFLLAIESALRRAARQFEAAPDFSSAAPAPAMRDFEAAWRAMLPFEPTRAQVRVIGEVAADMVRPSPMNRLLQGDVGSGKTAVAAAAVLLAKRAGYQAAFMAPTEILAAQQFARLNALLSHAGVRMAMLTGALRRQTRDEIVDQLRSGELDVVVGTHALIVEDVAFAKLGLVVIDEQHRFGVLQRAALRAKAKGHAPHTLVMTATPIPRTLAQTIYADLEVSILDELPPGRKPVRTFVRTTEDKEKIFAFIRDEVDKGRQAYVVCPAVDESERAIHNAVEQAERLRGTAFKGYRVGLLHGRMSGQDKNQIMRLFADGFTQILITTTVVEVGVDVANASVMLVLDAQTFGLAQLHQLRGRVGRGAATSYCILVASPEAEGAARLEILASTNDGFVVAEEDYKIRGSGDITGTRQHGNAELRLAHLIRDYPVFVEAKKEADSLVGRDPKLERPENASLARFLAARDREAALLMSS